MKVTVDNREIDSARAETEAHLITDEVARETPTQVVGERPSDVAIAHIRTLRGDVVDAWEARPVDPVAVYAAVVATFSAGAAVLTRVEARWGRKAKLDEDVRPNLYELREALTQAGGPAANLAALSTYRTRAALDALGEVQGRHADRRMRRLLADVRARCAVAAGTTSTSGTLTYAQSDAIAQALRATTAAVSRLDKFQRKAPSG